jgi:hypothetical protein
LKTLHEKFEPPIPKKHALGEMSNAYTILVENLNGRDHFGDVSID